MTRTHSLANCVTIQLSRCRLRYREAEPQPSPSTPSIVVGSAWASSHCALVPWSQRNTALCPGIEPSTCGLLATPAPCVGQQLGGVLPCGGEGGSNGRVGSGATPSSRLWGEGGVASRGSLAIRGELCPEDGDSACGRMPHAAAQGFTQGAAVSRRPGAGEMAGGVQARCWGPMRTLSPSDVKTLTGCPTTHLRLFCRGCGGGACTATTAGRLGIALLGGLASWFSSSGVAGAGACLCRKSTAGAPGTRNIGLRARNAGMCGARSRLAPEK